MIELICLSGQSEYTADNKFAGWTDVNLSAQGEQEALQAGKLIQNITIDQIHISALRRAQQTLDKIRSELTKCAPVYKTWRLNERHYGQLEGCNKIETAKLYGVEQVKKLRRDWNTKPPPVDRSDSRWPHSYEPEPTEPFSESPSDCYNRVLPYLEDKLLPLIREQKTILVIAHGTSLRCLVKFLGGLDPEAPASQEIPSGVPVIYTVDPNSLRIVETKQFLNQKELTRRQELVAKESEPANY